MKKLADGTEVTSRSYYFLLDFNDRDNWKTIQEKFSKMKLHELTREEYKTLFSHATQQELKKM